MGSTNLARIRTIAIFILTAFWASHAHAFDLMSMSKMDVVVVGIVAKAPPTIVYLQTADYNGTPVEYAPNPGKYALYRLTNVIALKGTAPSEITVVGDATRELPPGNWGSSGIFPSVPQPGKRLLVFLHRSDKGRFNMEPSANADPEECEFLEAPKNVDLRFDGIHTMQGWKELSDEPKELPIHHDYLGYDIARIFLVAYGARESGENTSSLWLGPDATQFREAAAYPEGYPDIVACRSLVGHDPAAFYRSEIEPKLKAMTTDAERLQRLLLAGSWGVEGVATQITDIIMAAGKITDPKFKKAAEYAARSVPHFDSGFANVERLLTNINPGVLSAVAQSLGSPKSKQFPPSVFRLLDDSDEEVLRSAMRALAGMFSDYQHVPKSGIGGGFEPGSRNAELLEYWRAKGPRW